MKVRFGVFADLHTDFMHDARRRVRKFLTECEKENIDFAIQLGDFCPPNRVHMRDKHSILASIRKWGIPFYHLLGNHDVDANTKKEALRFLGTKERHYSFDAGEVHFVILDANFFELDGTYNAYEKGNYRGLPKNAKLPILPPKELEWLAKDLQNAAYPAVIFTHQSLVESRAGIKNAEEFREVVRKAPKGVLMAVCGHEHVDRLEKKEDVWYYCVNSMSYYWTGSRYKHDTYPKSLTEKFPKLECIFPYREPIFAIIEIEDDVIRIRGRRTWIVGAKPAELNFVREGLEDKITSKIKTRTIKTGAKKYENI